MKKKIFLVEDREFDHRETIAALEAEGIEFKIVKNTRDAISALSKKNKSSTFDGAIIDLLLPEASPAPQLKEYISLIGHDSPYIGQALGLWISKNLPDLPYVYFSLVPTGVEIGLEQNNSNYKGIIDKKGDKPLLLRIRQTIEDEF